MVSDHSLIGQVLTVVLHDLGFRTRHLNRRETSPDRPPAHPPGQSGGLAVLVLEPDRPRNPLSDAEIGGPVADLVSALCETGHTVLVLIDAAALNTEDKSVVEAAGAAIEAGAAGVLDTAQSLDTLLETLSMASAGRLPETIDPRDWINQHDLTGHRRHSRMRRRLHQLTPREREILNLLYHGQRATSIAEHCGISVATVRSQIRSILTKLDVHSQIEAVALLR